MSADPRNQDSVRDDPLELDDTTRQLTRSKAMRIVRSAGFSPTDVDDLEQDIGIHVWKRLEKFDQSKADHAVFVRMLIAHAAATALRDRKRRTRRAPLSLVEALRDGGSPAEPVDERLSRREAETALALDVAGVLALLPKNLRRVAEALKTHSVAAAARQLGMSRATVYARLEELRQAFESVGLRQFAADRQTLRKRSG